MARASPDGVFAPNRRRQAAGAIAISAGPKIGIQRSRPVVLRNCRASQQILNEPAVGQAVGRGAVVGRDALPEARIGLSVASQACADAGDPLLLLGVERTRSDMSIVLDLTPIFIDDSFPLEVDGEAVRLRVVPARSQAEGLSAGVAAFAGTRLLLACRVGAERIPGIPVRTVRPSPPG
jgi:hypothetical protein